MRILRWLDKNFEKTLLGILLIGMTVVLVAQIALRVFFHSSLAWAEEVSRFMLVWSGFLSVSFTIHNGSAMRLTMILSVLPRLARNAILLLAQSVMLFFFLWLAKVSIDLLGMSQQYSPALELPLYYVYLIIPVGFILTVYRVLQNIKRMVLNFIEGVEAGMEKAREDEALHKEIEEGGATDAR